LAHEQALTALAPAKINLVLEVTGRRSDGYHEIDTVLQTLALADSVTLREGDGLRVAGPYAGDLPSAEDANLVRRAETELRRHAIGEGAFGWSIDKRVPAAGGLGGGSSDAATALRLLQKRWPGATDAALFEAAAATGSDVPFFLVGGTARAQGRGEQVTPLPALPAHGVVLFVSPAGIERKTARMFEALGGTEFDDGRVAANFASAPPGRFTGADVFNSFERVAFDVFPRLGKLWEAIERRTGEPARLAGAGPTLFWIGPPERAAGVAARAQGLACTVIQTATAGSLWRR
jgi:4-diphosphocytidyl-2-C-methyl-D-erythritol kinase